MTAGIELDVSAQVSASLGSIAQALRAEADHRQRMATAIRQVPFAGSVPLTGGAGTYDAADQLQAKTGYFWSIRRLTVQGFTAGSVTAYRNSAAGEPVMPFPAPAVNTIGRGELLLMPGDRLVFSATGITGSVTFWGVADCFESWYLPHYIG